MSAEMTVIDREAATALLTDLHGRRWGWTRDELVVLAKELGWTNFEIMRSSTGNEMAFADAAVRVGGEEVEAILDDAGHVRAVKITVARIADGKAGAARTALTAAWRGLVELGIEQLGAPTQRTGAESPDAQWRGEVSTLGIQHLSSGIVVNWVTNEYQDHWNRLKKEPR